jgi:hypothetical protein
MTVIRLIIYLLLLPIFLFPTVSDAEILYFEDMEGITSAGPFTPYSLIPGTSIFGFWGARPAGMYISRSNSAFSGNYSLQFYAPQGDPNYPYNSGANETHCEASSTVNISDDAKFAWNTEYWVSYRMWVASNHPFPSGAGYWHLLSQFKQLNDACDGAGNPPGALYMTSDGSNKVSYVQRGDPRQCHDTPQVWDEYPSNHALNLGAWNTLVYNFRISHDSSGFMRIWLNGDQFVNHNDSTGYNSAYKVFFRIGIYGVLNSEAYVRYDDFRIGDANATYADMVEGTPDPDSAPPVFYNFSPTSILPAGTTQTTISGRTDEVATCKWGTSNNSYTNLPNTFTGEGSFSHTDDSLTGLTDGSTTDIYVRCQDDEPIPNTNTTSFQYSVTVGSASGAVNLLSTDVCTIDVDLPAWSDFSNAFDGAVGNLDSDAVASWDAPQAVVTCIFPTPFTAPVWRIYGDDDGTLVSNNWTARYRAQSNDPWTTAFSNQSCIGQQWYEQDFSGTISTAIQHVEFTITGGGTGFQFAELWMNADHYDAPRLVPNRLRFQQRSQ